MVWWPGYWSVLRLPHVPRIASRYGGSAWGHSICISSATFLAVVSIGRSNISGRSVTGCITPGTDGNWMPGKTGPPLSCCCLSAAGSPFAQAILLPRRSFLPPAIKRWWRRFASDSPQPFFSLWSAKDRLLVNCVFLSQVPRSAFDSAARSGRTAYSCRPRPPIDAHCVTAGETVCCAAVSQ